MHFIKRPLLAKLVAHLGRLLQRHLADFKNISRYVYDQTLISDQCANDESIFVTENEKTS